MSGGEVVHAATAAARRDLADLLSGLRPQDWAVQSLCAGWDVRTVTAHLVAATDPALAPFLLAVLRARGDLHRANDDLARQLGRRPTGELVDQLRLRAGSRTSPPVVGPRGPVTDVLVHTGDLSRPLGLPHRAADPAVRHALDFLVHGRPVGFVRRGRLSGLRLVAVDLGSTWGEGADVVGAGVDLMMAACGRDPVPGSLDGPGARLLAARS